MSESTVEQKTTEPTIEPGEEEAKGLSNREWKDHKETKKLTSQLAAYQKTETERIAAEEEAKKAAALKKAEETGEYKDALKALQDELAQTKKQHASEMIKRDLASELRSAGFTSNLFVKGALVDFQEAAKSDPGVDVSTFVAQLLDDESNSQFLQAQLDGQSPRAKPPAKPPSSGGPTSWDKVKAETNSSDPTVRAKSRAQIEAHFKETGEWP